MIINKLFAGGWRGLLRGSSRVGYYEGWRLSFGFVVVGGASEGVRRRADRLNFKYFLGTYSKQRHFY